MILPGDLWQALWDAELFSHFIVEDQQEIRKFWKQCGNHPGLHNHPVKRIPNYQQYAVPILLHGDGAPVAQQIGSASKSCLFLSWRSLVSGSSSTHFLMTAVWASACSKAFGAYTSKAIFSILTKAWQNLLDNRGMSTGGFFPVVVFSTGDLEYYADYHQVARWNSNFPCCLCTVAKENIGKIRAVEDLKIDSWIPRQHPCPLFRSLCSPACIAPDYMHSKHLGVDLRLLGSVIWMLLFGFDDRRPLEDKLHQVLYEMQEFWRHHRLTNGLQNLTIGMVCDPNDKQCRNKFPRLKAKAAEASRCVIALDHLWQQKMDKENPAHIWIKLALEGSRIMDEIVKKHSEEWCIPGPEAERLWKASSQYFVCNSALQNHFQKEGKKLFQAGTFKFHWLLHSSKLAAHINPCRLWCYSGESYMHVCKVLMQSCLKGRGALSALHLFMTRYNIAMSMELNKTWRLMG